MPVFNFPAHDMAAGAREVTADVVVPSGLIRIRHEGIIRQQDLTDPGAQCRGGYERMIAPDTWIEDMSWSFAGGPLVETQPFFELSQRDLAPMAGMTVRGFLVAITAGRYGWTARIE